MPDYQSSNVPAEFAYLAFLSYARDDNLGDGQCWADWMKGMIQSFPVPQRLVGQATDFGKVAGNLGEVFLDRTGMAPALDLTAALRTKLGQSRFLVLIGSPKSATSRYVGLEIEEFAKFHGIERIILVAIDGDEPETWVHSKFIGCLRGAKLPTYVDFRVKETDPRGRKFRTRGWTSPEAYCTALIKSDKYSEGEIQRRLTAYERDYRDAKFQLLAALTGLSLIHI